jgi:hypothetical protein
MMSEGQKQKKKTTWQVGGGLPEEVGEQKGKMPTLNEFLSTKGIDAKRQKNIKVFKDRKAVDEKEFDEPMDEGDYALATAPKAGKEDIEEEAGNDVRHNRGCQCQACRRMQHRHLKKIRR